MTFTPADLDSAIDKLGSVDFTEAETEAVAYALSSAPEVEGFTKAPQRPGQGFILEVAGLIPAARNQGNPSVGRAAGRIPPTNDVVQSTVVA